ncbi:MAG: TetR/AcrR family transcriptional regulator [Spirochaetales bacterium]|nr:TetR/AcrR family transcriptional regulator [Spirochaetales bacterium]
MDLAKQTPSQAELERREGVHQVEQTRIHILNKAEDLFLEKGLANTTMTDIAASANISRLSLYRYFSNIDPIAFEIAVRMIRKINVEGCRIEGGEKTLPELKSRFISQIEQFPMHQKAYRYLSIFDHVYGVSYPDEELANWYQEQLNTFGWEPNITNRNGQKIPLTKLVMIANSVMGYLEKKAERGELMSKEQGISLDEELIAFKENVEVYLDYLYG